MPLLCKVPWPPCNGTSTPPKLVVTLLFPHHSTPQWHPAMAPSNGTMSTPPKLVVTLLPSHSTLLPSPHHSTLQWHPAMAPCPLPQSWSSPSPPTIAHTTMAPYDGTQQWHHVHSPKVGRHMSSPSPPTIAHYNGSLQWHPPGATSNPPKWFVALPPFWK